MATVRVHDAAELGAAVREARAAAGLSQTGLAAEAAVGRQWLVEFEAGDKLTAPFDMVMRLLRVLAVDVVLDAGVPRRPRSTRRDALTASEVLNHHAHPIPTRTGDE